MHNPQATALTHAEIFGNRVRKNFDRLAKGFARQHVDVFRLYDRDIPEVRAVADFYAGRIVVGVYDRDQTNDIDNYAEQLGLAAARALGIDKSWVHTRHRHTRPEIGERYRKQANLGQRIEVCEGSLRFWVNLHDYLDTGLFGDHRPTRQWLQQHSAGKDALNLFAYTGSFSVAAAAGQAKSTTTVDTSTTYLGWFADNLALNQLTAPQHTTAEVDARHYLDWAARHGRRFDVVLCDPPSFSDRPDGDFVVQRDHRALVDQCLRVLQPGGVVLFSTNHQRFEPQLEGLAAVCLETTAQTVPADYRNRQVHRSWRLQLA